MRVERFRGLWRFLLGLSLVFILLSLTSNASFSLTSQSYAEEASLPSSSSNSFSQPEISASGGEKKMEKAASGGHYAVFTMITDPNFIAGAQMLAYSVGKWRRADTDMVAMIMKGSGTTRLQRMGLEAVGWRLVDVEPIPAPQPPLSHYANMFTKLWAWHFEEYRRILYMDADMLSLRSQDDALHGLSENVPLAAVRDFTEGNVMHRFNAGLLGIRPNRSLLAKFRELIASNGLSYEPIFAEQGWLNAYFPNFHELSHLHNVNTNVWYRDRALWDQLKAYIKGLHLTDRKHFLMEHADWDRLQEPAQLCYTLREEMLHSKGYSLFGFVSIADCEQLRNLSDIRRSLESPLLLVTQCKPEEMPKIAEDKNLVTVEALKPCNAHGATAPSDLWSEESFAFTAKVCLPQLAAEIAASNPTKVAYHYFIDFDTLAAHASSISAHLKSRFKGEVPLDMMETLRVKGVRSGDGKETLGFGGVSFALQSFAKTMSGCNHSLWDGLSLASALAPPGKTATLRSPPQDCPEKPPALS